MILMQRMEGVAHPLLTFPGNIGHPLPGYRVRVASAVWRVRKGTLRLLKRFPPLMSRCGPDNNTEQRRGILGRSFAGSVHPPASHPPTGNYLPSFFGSDTSHSLIFLKSGVPKTKSRPSLAKAWEVNEWSAGGRMRRCLPVATSSSFKRTTRSIP